MATDLYDCPQCGTEEIELVEGVCEDCWVENQNELILHNARFDRWEKLTDAERVAEIRNSNI